MALQPCPKCINGRMGRELYFSYCRPCRERQKEEGGVAYCDSCWVHPEWSCINCGYTAYGKSIRRKDLLTRTHT